MLSLLAGCVLLLYLSVSNKRNDCSSDQVSLSVNGRVISIEYLDEAIYIHSQQSGLHKLEVYDKCAQNKIKSIEVKSEK